MAMSRFQSGEVISLLSGETWKVFQTTTLVKTADLELIRLIIPEGKVIPRHKAPGEITVQCLGGRVSFTTENATRELHAGELLYLAAGEPHALKGLEDSSLLLTRVLSKNKKNESN